MKNFKRITLNVAKIVWLLTVSVIFLESCNSGREEVSPDIVKKGIKYNSARISSNCSNFNSGNMTTAERDRLVSMYGSDAGSGFDYLKANYNPNDARSRVQNYNGTIYNYLLQIENALLVGSKKYANALAQEAGNNYNAEVNYDSDVYKNCIEAELSYIIANFRFDNSLTADQRDLLNAVVRAFRDNWEQSNSIANDNVDCFPNPNWYSASGARISFRGILRVVNKIINIVATLAVNIVEQAAQMAVIGITGGFIVAGGPLGVLPGLASGAIIGGVLGIVKGINDMIAGNFVCVFACNI